MDEKTKARILEALEAAEAIKSFCGGRQCDDCLFADGAFCMFVDVLADEPCNWNIAPLKARL